MAEVRYAEELEIEAPGEQLFAYRLDFENLPTYNPNVSNLRRVDGGSEPGPGAVYRFDITMPDKDGVTALKEIIGLDPAARVVMCSALGQESKVLEAIRCGAKDFVVKPFQPERIQQAIEKALA